MAIAATTLALTKAVKESTNKQLQYAYNDSTIMKSEFNTIHTNLTSNTNKTSDLVFMVFSNFIRLHAVQIFTK